MATKTRTGESADGSALEFEDFPGRADIQISKVLTTAEGEKIRAIVTTGGSVVLTAVGAPNGDTLILTGEPGSIPTDPDSYKLFWSKVGEVAAKIAAGLLGGSGGMKCTTTTTNNFQDGKLVSQTIVTECTPA